MRTFEAISYRDKRMEVEVSPIPKVSPSISRVSARDSCGDRNTVNNNTWYPVYVDYTQNNLKIIRNNFCRDAYIHYRSATGITSIQVASFTSRQKAEAFVEMIKSQIGSGEIGEPTYYLRDNYTDDKGMDNYSFPMNTCGDSQPNTTNSKWYPVYVDNTMGNLQTVRNNLCRDAYVHYRRSIGITSIQVASFTSKKRALIFTQIIKNKIGSAEVGEPKIITRP